MKPSKLVIATCFRSTQAITIGLIQHCPGFCCQHFTNAGATHLLAILPVNLRFALAARGYTIMPWNESAQMHDNKEWFSFFGEFGGCFLSAILLKQSQHLLCHHYYMFVAFYRSSVFERPHQSIKPKGLSQHHLFFSCVFQETPLSGPKDAAFRHYSGPVGKPTYVGSSENLNKNTCSHTALPAQQELKWAKEDSKLATWNGFVWDIFWPLASHLCFNCVSMGCTMSIMQYDQYIMIQYIYCSYVYFMFIIKYCKKSTAVLHQMTYGY